LTESNSKDKDKLPTTGAKILEVRTASMDKKSEKTEKDD